VKILQLLTALTILLPISLKAQKIKVLDAKGTPVSQAVIQMKTIGAGREEVFLTNNKGEANLSNFQTPSQLVITHVAFNLYVDTLVSTPRDFIVMLIAKDVKLSEVVVTSEYTPRTAGESIHPVMVINRSQIESQTATNLEQVLSQQLNMRINPDQILGSGLTMNGISGQNIKFLVDGVPVIGRLDGNIDLSQINLNNVERIEVVNGPMAASYGTDASGGVINLITKQSVDNRYQVGANFLYDYIGNYNVDVSTGYNTGKSSILVSGGRNFFDGWSKTDTSRKQEWKPKEQYFGNVKYRWVGKKLILGYQLSAFNETISNKGLPHITPYFAYAFDEYYKTIRLTNQLNGTYIINNNYLLNGTVAYSNYNRNKNTYRKDLVTLNETIIPGSQQQDTTILNTLMIRQTFSRTKKETALNYQAGIDFNIENAEGTRFNNQVKHAADYAFFASAEYKINSKFEVKPAVRLAYNTDYKAPVVPSVMFKYEINSKMQARLSYGKGFRAPGIKESYLYFVDINHNILGNENLLPEYSDNFFLSVNNNYNIGNTNNTVELSGFYNDIRNMITLAQPDPTSSLYTYINLGKFSTHGLNLNNNVNFKQFTLGAGFSYTGRYNIYADSGNFSKYIYSPDLNANAQYFFSKLNLTTSVYFKFNGKLPGYMLNDDNTITQFSNDSYKFLDATIRKGFLGQNVYLAAGVKNILDVTNVNAIAQGSAHSSSNDDQAISTGRSFFVKLELNITK
jgi:outer membrane receptor for ferrienterochelin and colicins